MITHLLESQEHKHRSLGTIISSIALHGALILLAIHATARAAVNPVSPHPTIDTLVFLPEPVPRPQPQPPIEHGSATPTHGASLIVQQMPIPLPTLSLDPPAIRAVAPVVTQRDFAGATGFGPATGSIDAQAEVLSSYQVDRIAEAVAGTPAPDYPDALKARGVQGSVVAQFVVDSSGRVEPASFVVISSRNDLFSLAVRNSLQRARFKPATLAGRPVRQLVQQSFSFVLR